MGRSENNLENGLDAHDANPYTTDLTAMVRQASCAGTYSAAFSSLPDVP
jgi:hypothetical protein